MKKAILFGLLVLSEWVVAAPVNSALGASGAAVESDAQVAMIPVEYLKSSYGQCILLPLFISRYQSEAPRLSIQYRYPSFSNTALFGSGTGSRLYSSFITSRNILTVQFGNIGRYERTDGFSDYHELDFIPSEGLVIEDGIAHSCEFNALNQSLDYLCLWGYYDCSTGKISKFARNTQIYGIQIYDSLGVEALYCLQPVRIGDIGYLYDEVSGELFGNMGTGDFIVGPDKE